MASKIESSCLLFSLSSASVGRAMLPSRRSSTVTVVPRAIISPQYRSRQRSRYHSNDDDALRQSVHPDSALPQDPGRGDRQVEDRRGLPSRRGAPPPHPPPRGPPTK